MSLKLREHAGSLQLVIVVGVVGAAVLLSKSLEPDSPGVRPGVSEQELAVSTVEPAQTSYSPLVRLNGVVEARTVTNVIPQVSGRVIEVSDQFRPGARIQKGDVLFIVDPADYELSVERTLADIEAARSELALLEAEAEAEVKVWESQTPDRPIPELIARIPQIAAAKARIRSGEAARRAAELSLERTVVRAPFDARVLETELDVGQVIGTNTAVGTLYSIEGLEIAVPISAEDARRIGEVEGRTVAIEIQDGRTLDGEVVRAAALLDSSTRLRTIYVAVDDREELTVGEFFAVEIEGRQVPEAYRLPTAALTSRDQLWVVEAGQLRKRTVEVLGSYGETTLVAIFDAADGVVALPPPNGRDGLPVDARPQSSLARSGIASPGAR